MARFSALSRQRALRETCLAIYAAHSRVDDAPYYHLCELPKRHPAWHVCWCGSGFTKEGVIGRAANVALGLVSQEAVPHVPE